MTTLHAIALMRVRRRGGPQCRRGDKENEARVASLEGRGGRLERLRQRIADWALGWRGRRGRRRLRAASLVSLVAGSQVKLRY
jgi:hypothetical protein